MTNTTAVRHVDHYRRTATDSLPIGGQHVSHVVFEMAVKSGFKGEIAKPYFRSQVVIHWTEALSFLRDTGFDVVGVRFDGQAVTSFASWRRVIASDCFEILVGCSKVLALREVKHNVAWCSPQDGGCGHAKEACKCGARLAEVSK